MEERQGDDSLALFFCLRRVSCARRLWGVLGYQASWVTVVAAVDGEDVGLVGVVLRYPGRRC